MRGKLYYFTNSFPYGIGEDWKYNELKVLSRHFQQIEIIPFQYDGNHKAKEINLNNVVAGIPLFENNSIIVTRSALTSLFTSADLLFYCKEFFRKSVFLKKGRLITFLSDAIKAHKLTKHPRIRQLIQTHNKQDVFYFFWGKGSCLFVPVLRKKIFSKVVVRFHGFDLYEYRNDGYIPFRHQLLKTIDRGLVISQNGLQYLTTKYPTFKNKITLNRLGTVEKGMSKESVDGLLRIFSCSSLIPLKRILLLARALKMVSFPVAWTHIGDGPLKEQLMAIVHTFPANIKFELTGWVDSGRVSDFYVGKQCDLFVNVSETEGIPVSIMEAFAASIPALATNVGGTREIVNNSNGRLLKPDVSEKELSEEISQFYFLPPLSKASMRNHAYQTFKELFDAEKNAEDLATICLQ